jgi:hypothetical protein
MRSYHYNSTRNSIWKKVNESNEEPSKYLDEFILNDIKYQLEECNTFRLRRILGEYCKLFNLTQPTITSRTNIVEFILNSAPLFGKPGLSDFIANMTKSEILEMKEV